MGWTGKAVELARRCMDDAMVFASLALLGWPALSAAVQRDGSRPAVALPVAVVTVLGVGIVLLARSRPLLPYLPVAAAVLVAAFRHYRDGTLSPGLTWLVIAISAIILVRQFLGARNNEDLLRDLS